MFQISCDWSCQSVESYSASRVAIEESLHLQQAVVSGPPDLLPGAVVQGQGGNLQEQKYRLCSVDKVAKFVTREASPGLGKPGLGQSHI